MPPRDKHGVLSNKFPRDRGYVGSRVVASGPLCKRRRAKSWQSDIVAAFCCDDNGKLYVLYLDSEPAPARLSMHCMELDVTGSNCPTRSEPENLGGGGAFQ